MENSVFNFFEYNVYTEYKTETLKYSTAGVKYSTAGVGNVQPVGGTQN